MRALLIGINYVGTKYTLNGCYNDVLNIKEYLINDLNYNEDEICILSDKITTTEIPNKQNVLEHIEDFIVSVNEQKYQNYFFHFSGHGTYMYDDNSDETDFKDECIVCQDLQLIKDDDIFILLQKIQNDKSVLYVLMDCCHSGTIFDLNSNYDFEKQEIVLNSKRVNLDANIVMISGCLDDQQSFDAYINKKYQGAMTFSFLNKVKENSNISPSELIFGMRIILKNGGYSQIPQLSFSNITFANMLINNNLFDIIDSLNIDDKKY